MIYEDPAYQNWYFSGDDAGEHFDFIDDDHTSALWTRSHSRDRRVHWHFLKNPIQQLPISAMEDTQKIHYVMSSKGNVGSSTSWVHARIAGIEDPDDDGAGGSIFYRMKHYGSNVALEFRIYAGLKCGSNGPAKKRWANIKDDVR